MASQLQHCLVLFEGTSDWLEEVVCKYPGYFDIHEVSKLTIKISMLGWLLLFFELNPGIPSEKGVPIFLI